MLPLPSSLCPPPVPTGCRYPSRPPLLYIESKGLAPSSRLVLAAALARKAASLAMENEGGAMVFELVSWVHESITSALLQPPPSFGAAADNVTTSKPGSGGANTAGAKGRQHGQQQHAQQQQGRSQQKKRRPRLPTSTSAELLQRWQQRQGGGDAKHAKMQGVRRSLPAYGYKEAIIKAIEDGEGGGGRGGDSGGVTLVQGETGCGKTTQVCSLCSLYTIHCTN
jgi:hypothetical protein